MARAIELLPELSGDELSYVDMIISNLPDDEARNFAMAYRSQRKNPGDILIFTVIGLVGIAGIQRFVLGQIGMGLLFLFTGGLCLIGSILDLINHKQLTFDHNKKVADRIAGNIRLT